MKKFVFFIGLVFAFSCQDHSFSKKKSGIYLNTTVGGKRKPGDGVENRPGTKKRKTNTTNDITIERAYKLLFGNDRKQKPIGNDRKKKPRHLLTSNVVICRDIKSWGEAQDKIESIRRLFFPNLGETDSIPEIPFEEYKKSDDYKILNSGDSSSEIQKIDDFFRKHHTELYSEKKGIFLLPRDFYSKLRELLRLIFKLKEISTSNLDNNSYFIEDIEDIIDSNESIFDPKCTNPISFKVKNDQVEEILSILDAFSLFFFEKYEGRLDPNNSSLNDKPKIISEIQASISHLSTLLKKNIPINSLWSFCYDFSKKIITKMDEDNYPQNPTVPLQDSFKAVIMAYSLSKERKQEISIKNPFKDLLKANKEAFSGTSENFNVLNVLFENISYVYTVVKKLEEDKELTELHNDLIKLENCFNQEIYNHLSRNHLYYVYNWLKNRYSKQAKEKENLLTGLRDTVIQIEENLKEISS